MEITKKSVFKVDGTVLLATTTDLFKRIWDCPDPDHDETESVLVYFDEYGVETIQTLDCDCVDITYSSINTLASVGYTTGGC